jgi:excisionase family DNA binding protein
MARACGCSPLHRAGRCQRTCLSPSGRLLARILPVQSDWVADLMSRSGRKNVVHQQKTIGGIAMKYQPSPEEASLLTVHEVARRLRVDDTTVRRWIKNGALEAISLPHRGTRQAYRIRQSTLEALFTPGPDTGPTTR